MNTPWLSAGVPGELGRGEGRKRLVKPVGPYVDNHGFHVFSDFFISSVLMLLGTGMSKFALGSNSLCSLSL